MSQDRLTTIQEKLGIVINPNFDDILELKEFGNLPIEVTELLETNDPRHYYLRYGSIGDGNCLYHAILNLINDNYLRESRINKKKICLQFKKYLGVNATIHDYKYLELDNKFPTLKNYKAHLRTNGKWGIGEDIIYISSIIKYNIFVFQYYRTEPNQKFVQGLVDMGYNKNSAIRATLATNNDGIEDALVWITTHSDDEDITNPLEEYPYNIAVPNCIQYSVYDETRPTIFLYNFDNRHYESIIRLRRDQKFNTKNITPDLRIFNPNESFINLLAHQYREVCLPISDMWLRNWRNSGIYLCKTDIYSDANGWEFPNNRGFCPRENPYSHNIMRRGSINADTDTCCHTNIDATDNGKLSFGHYEVDFTRKLNKEYSLSKSQIKNIKKKYNKSLQKLYAHGLDEDMAIYLLKIYEKSEDPIKIILDEIEALKARTDLTDADLNILIDPSSKSHTISRTKSRIKSRTMPKINKLTKILKELSMMGFNDVSLNKKLYKIHRGNKQLIIEELLQTAESESEDSESVKSESEDSESVKSESEESDVDDNLTNPDFDDYAVEDILGNTLHISKQEINLPYNHTKVKVVFFKGNPLKSGKYENYKSLYYQFNNDKVLTRVGVLNETKVEMHFFDDITRIIEDYVKQNPTK